MPGKAAITKIEAYLFCLDGHAHIPFPQEHSNSNMSDCDFSFIRDSHSRTMIRNGYNASTILELGDWFRTWNPEADKGYMFSSHPNIGKLLTAVEGDGHSGASFAWLCRNLQAYYRDPVAYELSWYRNMAS
jgi:hypothetical protein